ncbi:MAG: nitric oxide reductase activation protein [Gammaproteobacteria bacterium]|nr:nitric oxide reductase activation protein [Gammaproteobacteria bacterium]
MKLSHNTTYEQIQALLDEWYEVEFTFIQTEPLVTMLLKLPPSDQQFLLDWARRIASIQIQLSYELISNALEHFEELDRDLIESWALHTMDSYDRLGLQPAMALVRDIDHFLEMRRELSLGATFEEHERVLHHFLLGLSGRPLKLEKLARGALPFTDSETIFIPKVLSMMESPKANFQLYKATLVYLWSQSRYGTFRHPIAHLAEQSNAPAQFIALFQSFDRLRLEAKIGNELPGLKRTMDSLNLASGLAELPIEWLPFVEQLSQPDCTIEDVITLTQQQLGTLNPLIPCDYQGELGFDAVAEIQQARIERERAQFRVTIDEILKEQKKQPEKRPEIKAKQVEDPNKPDGFDIEIHLDQAVLAMPPVLKSLKESIMQDFGEIPPEYLQPAGPGDYDPKFHQDNEETTEDAWSGTYHEEGALLYDEWDHARQHYRKNWCAVREAPIEPVYDNFVSETRRKYSPLIKQLRKTFEAMRDENRLLKRQENGDGIDMEALVEALADRQRGEEMSDRLYTHMHIAERNIAVIFMVDMSGSTKGWINDAERESLLLLCEALESLNDRYAIYGFSGTGRKRCEIYTIKEFDDHYDDEVRGRISAVRAKDYTRMGFAIRHLTAKLQQIDAKTRILITISDGKPDDYMDYHGEYGIEDTRRALIEARRSGIHPYCITIDETAQDYLPHLYGPAAYTVIDNVARLPFKVSDIYRRLTI